MRGTMDVLVEIVNKLQEALMVVGSEIFEFPVIVVVGDQSSGKSSVLEGLVGKSFLPRGVGIVTRRPLLLRLETLRDREKEDYVIFQHQKKTFTDFKEVMREIEEETERVAGTNKGICSEPIVLNLFSKNTVSNLTLIDLPGLVKVPMGDQPPDIESRICDLIRNYISNPHSIILAIVTANTDIATSESLKIAREIDPDGQRTLVILTKLDLMDAGTNAMEILKGNLICAKLGVVGVVNRSQKDINENKSIEIALKEESDFFKKFYPLIAHKHGTFYLAKHLQKLLIDHVQKYLPQLKVKVHTVLEKYMTDLKALTGSEMRSSNESLLQILTNLARSYTNKIQGKSSELMTHELGGGARISYIFHEIFSVALNSINPLESYNKEAILTAARNSSGAKPCIFLPETCFEILVKKQIMRLEAPALRCVQLVYDEMEKILYTCTSKSNLVMRRYPKLSQKILEVAIRLLKSRLPETNKFVQSLIAIQGAYINTAHPDFKKVHFESQPEKFPSTDVNSLTVMMIEKLILVYFGIVRKSIQDLVPKAIMHTFVNFVSDNILSELVNHLYGTSQQNDELLEESVSIVKQKKSASQMIEALERANSIITEIQEGHFFLELHANRFK